ncbi:helix-turn-helix domain-containing protein [Inquilinus sp. CAU 1745]|uniref:helix-turn-helix domain-containing protein n=1 Tax=Inquilinus sp. CAU 1745 TaxID=3140369 RepID=UPI00325A4D98
MANNSSSLLNSRQGLPEFATLREAAALLRMSERTLRRRIRDGLVTVSQRRNGPILIHRDVLYAALEMRRRGEI